MNDRLRSFVDESYDAVVVGAGVGGLVTAALLARHGRKVLVLDQHTAPGGNATVFRRTDYEFDVGIHYLGGCHPDGTIPRVLRACGVHDVEFEEMDPDGYDTLVFPDFEFKIPKRLDRFQQRLCDLFPEETRGIRRYAKLLAQTQRLLDTASSVPRVMAAIPRCLLLFRSIGMTFGQFLDTCTDNRKLRAILTGQCGDYGMPPSEVSVLVPAAVAMHYLQGAYFPKGGGQVISDRLAEAIEDRGGKILLMARVRRILVEKGCVRGVEFESKHVGCHRVRAPVVVSNADLKHTMGKLVGPEHMDETALRRLESFEMSLATGVLYAGIRGDLGAEGHPRTNYWIHPRYDLEELFAATRRGQFHPEPFVYVSIASLKDPSNKKLSPEGVTNLQLMSLAPSQPQSWGVTEEEFATGEYRKNAIYHQRKAEYARRLLAIANRVFPSIDRRILFQEVATPLTHRRFTRRKRRYAVRNCHLAGADAHETPWPTHSHPRSLLVRSELPHGTGHRRCHRVRPYGCRGRAWGTIRCQGPTGVTADRQVVAGMPGLG